MPLFSLGDEAFREGWLLLSPQGRSSFKSCTSLGYQPNTRLKDRCQLWNRESHAAKQSSPPVMPSGTEVGLAIPSRLRLRARVLPAGGFT